MSKQQTPQMSLYTPSGQRKYINAQERERFLAAALATDGYTRTLCMTLAYTGCRISEALELKVASVQLDGGVIAFRSLKKRGRMAVREIPVPSTLIDALEEVHGINNAQKDMLHAAKMHLWPWKRTRGWERVKAVMLEARISGIQATPKGLRHGFGIRAIQSAVPLNLVQKWLGHAQMSTTAIYTNAVGPEESAIAMRMWNDAGSRL